MSCNGCAKSFGFLCKEKACGNCGFAFCSGCLKHKVKTSTQPKSDVSVCYTCHKKMTHPSNMSGGGAVGGAVGGAAARPPPDALLKRLSALDRHEPPKNPITVYKEANTRISKLKRGLSVEDKAIADRLERLKQDRKRSMELPTEDEMSERLAKLKGVEAAPSPRSAADQRALLGLKTDHRSGPEKSHDLIAQARDEVALEGQRLRPEDDIAQRLARLKGLDVVPPSSSARPPEIDPSEFLAKGQDGAAAGSSANPVDGAKNVSDLAKVIGDISSEANADAVKALGEYSGDAELQAKVQAALSRSGGGGARKGGKEDDDQMSVDEDEDDDEAEEVRIIESALAEARIDERLGNPGEDDDDDVTNDVTGNMADSQKKLVRQIDRSIRSGENAVADDGKKKTKKQSVDEEEEEDDEFPWCSICNDDAKFRCQGCDGDLYCRNCLKECHDEFEIKDHKFAPFVDNKCRK